MRLAVAGQRDEDDVFAAGTLDVAAADDALRVGEQHDLDEHSRRIRCRARGIVAEAGIETGQV